MGWWQPVPQRQDVAAGAGEPGIKPRHAQALPLPAMGNLPLPALKGQGRRNRCR